MEKIAITGGRALNGEIAVNGAKNAIVGIIPAALLCDEECTIENLPDIEDVRSLYDAITKLGAKCEFINRRTIKINGSSINCCTASAESVKKLRASYYLMGALLGKYKSAEVALPGGCDFGTRPIDQHIKGFEQLGAKVRIEHGTVKMEADKLVGANIYFDVATVGATINLMIAAVFAEGVTVLENAAKEPHVVDTANFLNSMGANVKGAGTDLIRIIGVEKLHGSEYMIIPDQIESGTYMIAAAVTGGDVTITGVIPKHLDSLSAKLSEMGAFVKIYDDAIKVRAEIPLSGINLKTMPYPGFPTDLQPQMTALLSTSNGRSIVTENIYVNRFQYINELKRLGADITVEGRVAIVEGGSRLSGTEVTASDLRAGASLVIGGLAAVGETIIGNVKYIDRGYESIENKLSSLGAAIKRIEV